MTDVCLGVDKRLSSRYFSSYSFSLILTNLVAQNCGTDFRNFAFTNFVELCKILILQSLEQ